MNEQIIIYALRYALPRQSVSPDVVCNHLECAWVDLSKQTQVKIREEIEYALRWKQVGTRSEWEELLTNL